MSLEPTKQKNIKQFMNERDRVHCQVAKTDLSFKVDVWEDECSLAQNYLQLCAFLALEWGVDGEATNAVYLSLISVFVSWFKVNHPFIPVTVTFVYNLACIWNYSHIPLGRALTHQRKKTQHFFFSLQNSTNIVLVKISN